MPNISNSPNGLVSESPRTRSAVHPLDALRVVLLIAVLLALLADYALPDCSIFSFGNVLTITYVLYASFWLAERAKRIPRLATRGVLLVGFVFFALYGGSCNAAYLMISIPLGIAGEWLDEKLAE